MREIKYVYTNKEKSGTLELIIKCPDEDYEWITSLFARNVHPIKVLNEIYLKSLSNNSCDNLHSNDS